MKKISIFILSAIIAVNTMAEELKVKADFFESDEKKGVSVFRGKVFVKKGHDELRSKKLTIYTDKQRHPVKFIAEGNVDFKIEDENKNKYKGKAQKAVYIPEKKEYRFYDDVHLVQIGEKKDIIGDEVVFSVVTGKSYAKGARNEPVIMIFDIEDKKKKNKRK
jgi:lipopolysaccharide export system protein LptA